MTEETKILEVEFQRVQTFLFQVPRLSDMDGANALLGDLVRRRLPAALKDFLANKIDEPTLEKLRELEAELAKAGDPLIPAGAAGANSPNANMSPCDLPSIHIAQGILVRDGGRVWARIKCDKIEQAKAAAAAAIHKACPGLSYAFHVRELEKTRSGTRETPEAIATDLVGLPCFRWAEDGGEEPASQTIKIGTDERRLARSSIVKRSARRKRKEFWDVASLLYEGKAIPAPPENEGQDFQDIASGRYLAVVHIDGNAIGQRSKAFGELPEESSSIALAHQVKMETFFLSMRSALRRAVAKALNTHFNDCPEHYRLLMMGGDDVLVVCRADKALPFVCDVAKELVAIGLADGKPLTIGAGIAIAKPNLPFHRLHQLAEELAASAKRVANDAAGNRRSVVDWLVTTSSWVNGVDEHRGRWERVCYRPEGGTVCETLLLTGKPYPILVSPDEPSLQALLALADNLRNQFGKGNKAAGKESQRSDEGVRSQLKWFLGELHKGRRYAELCWNELPERFRQVLLETTGHEGLKLPDPAGSGLWQSLGGGFHRTWLPDLFELMELHLIGAKLKVEAKQGESEHAP